jgi:hypothetical protein
MNETLKANADKQLAAYAGAKRRYIEGRKGAALIQAQDIRLSPEQVAYWLYLAEGCAALLGQ